MSFTSHRRTLTGSLLALALVGLVTSCAAPIDDSQEEESVARGESELVAVADLGTLTGANGTSQAYSINAQGTIVGYSLDASGAVRAVTWVNRSIRTLPLPSGTVSSVALDINANNVAVGWRSDANGRTRAIRWTGTSNAADLAPSFDGDTLAESLNDRGEIVGWARPTGGTKIAVRFVNGGVAAVLAQAQLSTSVASDIGNLASGTNSVLGQSGAKGPFEQGNAPPGTPGALMFLPTPAGTSYTGLNAASGDGNAAVGWFRISTGPRHAIVWRANVVAPNTFPSSWSFQDLGTLGGLSSVALGINPAGTTIVGMSEPSSGGQHAFMRRQGAAMVDLGGLSTNPSCMSAAYGINQAGTIVGNSCTSAGNGQHAAAWN